MGDLLTGIAAAVLVSFAIERLTEYFVAFPLEKAAPNVDREWLRYAVLVFGGAASWFSGWDMFTKVAALDPLVGQILTAAIVGAGPEIIHRIVKEPQVPERALQDAARRHAERVAKINSVLGR
jgi:hypothetical protein